MPLVRDASSLIESSVDVLQHSCTSFIPLRYIDTSSFIESSVVISVYTKCTKCRHIQFFWIYLLWQPTPSTSVAAPAVAVSAIVVPVAVAAPTVFHIGQQVYITNRITHVLTRCATEADRTAHRHPKNLRPLN